MAAIQFSNEEEWHALRDMHVGGSDIASLFNVWLLPDGTQKVRHLYEAPGPDDIHLECVSPYKSSYALWQEKAGVLKPDFEETERMEAGKHLEPALASWAQSKWPEWKLRKVRRYLRHDDCEGWGASRDYEVHEAGYPPVEFKNVDFMIYRDQWGGTEDDMAPPLHISLQLQNQIGAGAKNCGHGWIVICVGGNRLYRVRVERHEPTQEFIRTAIDMFWAGVKAETPPIWIADSETVAKLASHEDVDKVEPVDLTDDEAAARDVRRFMRWKRHANFVDHHLDGIKARIGVKMLDSTKAKTASGSVTWPIIKRESKIIPARLQDEKIYRGGFTVRPIKEGN
jgi:predicted phage-related endonuclease